MEGSTTFCQKNALEAPRGLFKEMFTNTQGKSDIVILISEIKYLPRQKEFLLHKTFCCDVRLKYCFEWEVLNTGMGRDVSFVRHKRRQV
jgi:hypothetical protein